MNVNHQLTFFFLNIEKITETFRRRKEVWQLKESFEETMITKREKSS